MKLFKSKLRVLALAAGSLAISAFSANAALVDYDAGDLVLSFYTTGGIGSTTNVSVSLGDAATSFRGNLDGTGVLTGSTYFTANGNGTYTFNTSLATALSNAFGSSWSSRTDLYWGIVGNKTNSASASAVGGDPRRTVYVSQGASDAAYSGLSAAEVAGVATNLQSFLGAFDAMNADSSTTLVATYDESTANSYESWQANGTRLADWDAFSASNATIGTTLATDRLLSITNGASPTGVVGTGSSIGTFSLSSTGTLTYSAVPEPSTYALLALAGVVVFFAIRRRKVQA